MTYKDVKAMLYVLIPPVKERTLGGVLVWLLEVFVRLFGLWFIVKVLGFHFAIGLG